MPDWTVPMDAGLCQRQTHCTVCGVSCWESRPWFDIEDLPSGLSLPILVCQACRSADPGKHRLRALLQARYRTDPGGNGRKHGAHD